MANEFVEVLDIDNTEQTLANSTTLTSLYSFTVPGGTLDEDNTVRLQAQGKISFNGSASLNLHCYYGGVVVATIVLQSNASVTDKGLVVEATLSGDGSINSQIGTIQGDVGILASQDLSVSPGFGSVGIGSGGDEDFEIRAQWSGLGAANSITIPHATLELIAYIEDVAADELVEPTACIWLNSPLNIHLDYTLRKDLYFYAPLEHDLVFMGYGGAAGFTRSSVSSATYADGATHSLAVDEPGFEYNNGESIGLKLTTSTETLSFDSANDLDNSNTLCWLQDEVFKSTPTNTNPFNASGVWAGSTSTTIHIRELLKFNRVLTAAEIAAVQAVLT